jgi:hypothetical protein
MRLLALCLLFLQQQAPDPNQKQSIKIVEPAPPPNSVPSPSGNQGRHVSDPPKDAPSVTNIPGFGWVANATALRQHIKSAKKPEARGGNDIIGLRLAITSTGAVRKIDVTAWRDPLLRAAVLKAAESWTFTPFSQGDVIAIVPISFNDGAAHSALWD